jgi:hypothetical protein
MALVHWHSQRQTMGAPTEKASHVRASVPDCGQCAMQMRCNAHVQLRASVLK